VTTVVIPFAGADGKSRLHESRRVRRTLSLAMLADVLAAQGKTGEAEQALAGLDAMGLAAPQKELSL